MDGKMKKSALLLVCIVLSASLTIALTSPPTDCTDPIIQSTWDSVFKQPSSGIAVFANGSIVGSWCGKYFAYKHVGAATYILFGHTELITSSGNSFNETFIYARYANLTDDGKDLVDSITNINEAAELFFPNGTDFYYENTSFYENYVNLRGSSLAIGYSTDEYSAYYRSTPGAWAASDHAGNREYSFTKNVSNNEYRMYESGTINNNYTYDGYTFSKRLWPPPLICAPNWNCGSWAACLNSSQKRNCTDSNNCGNNATKPFVTQTCTCTSNWSCSSWANCSNGTQTRDCNDMNNCGNNATKPFVNQTCCTPNWNCGSWAACLNSSQKRNCTDSNNCGNNATKPFVTQTCTCTSNWSCSSWANCSNGTQTRDCNDMNNCGNNATKPFVNQTCCTPNWNCGSWTLCLNSTQTRACNDRNNCGTAIGRPPQNQSCAQNECASNSDCDSGEACSDNECVAASLSPKRFNVLWLFALPIPLAVVILIVFKNQLFGASFEPKRYRPAPPQQPRRAQWPTQAPYPRPIPLTQSVRPYSSATRHSINQAQYQKLQAAKEVKEAFAQAFGPTKAPTQTKENSIPIPQEINIPQVFKPCPKPRIEDKVIKLSRPKTLKKTKYTLTQIYKPSEPKDTFDKLRELYQ